MQTQIQLGTLMDMPEAEQKRWLDQFSPIGQALIYHQIQALRSRSDAISHANMSTIQRTILNAELLQEYVGI